MCLIASAVGCVMRSPCFAFARSCVRSASVNAAWRVRSDCSADKHASKPLGPHGAAFVQAKRPTGTDCLVQFVFNSSRFAAIVRSRIDYCQLPYIGLGRMKNRTPNSEKV